MNNNRYKQYCDNCYYTVYPNEGLLSNSGKTVHNDCKMALSDGYRRTLNPRIEQMLGKVSKKKLKEMWSSYE